MSDKKRKITLAGYFHSDSSTPGWDGSSTLTLYGKSPGGQHLEVVISVSPTSLGYLGRTVRTALAKHEASLEEAKRRARGDEQ